MTGIDWFDVSMTLLYTVIVALWAVALGALLIVAVS